MNLDGAETLDGRIHSDFLELATFLFVENLRSNHYVKREKRQQRSQETKIGS